MAHPNDAPKRMNEEMSIDENVMTQQHQDATHTDENLMVHRLHTSLSDTLESHSDVKNKSTSANIEKGTTTAIDMPPSQNEKGEEYSTDGEEEIKKPSKFSLFYQRHLPWFQ